MIIKNKTLFTTHPSSDREKKNLLFLNLIHRQKSISRTEISKLTDITAVTVSNYINGYLKKGLVLERGYEVSSGGRRPELVEINKEWGYVVGLDINKSDVKITLMNMGSDILTTASFSFPGNEKLNDILEKTARSAKVEKSQFKKIGISGQNMEKEIGKLEDAVKIPVLISERALCSAYGEKTLNPELKEASSVLYVYTDLGQCVFIKDEEFYEASNEGDKYSYLRAWSEALSVVNEAKRMVAEGVGTKIVDLAEGAPENITLDTIIQAAKDKDEPAADLIKTSGMDLGVRVAYLINLLKPETVVIGGGIEKAGNMFLAPLSSSIKKFVSSQMCDKIKVVLSLLGEGSGSKGAASLALREIFIEA